MNTTAQGLQAVRVMVHGRLLDSACFASAADAERYKAAVRGWAARKGIAVQVWCQAARRAA